MRSAIHYKCGPCDFDSTNKSHYTRHLKTDKHKKIIKNLQYQNTTIPYHCKCGKEFKHSSSYTRHNKKCYYSANNNTSITDREIHLVELLDNMVTKLVDKNNNMLQSLQEQNTNTLQGVTQSFKDVIDVIDNSSINSINNNNNNNNNNIHLNNQIVNNQTKIQFLNQNMSEMIGIDTFIDNYKNKYQFTEEQTKTLLESYQLNGVLTYAKCLCGYLKENCHQQLQDKNIQYPKEISFPVALTDHNIRTFKVKNEDEWTTTSDDKALSKIIVISNDQVYLYHQTTVPLTGSEKQIVINYIKKDNSFYKIKEYFPQNT